MNKQRKPLFDLGQCVATPGALETLGNEGLSPTDLLGKHVVGEWGDVCEEDAEANEQALRDGSRIFSVYVLPKTDEKVWVITEATDDSGRRRSTAILRPDEY